MITCLLLLLHWQQSSAYKSNLVIVKSLCGQLRLLIFGSSYNPQH